MALQPTLCQHALRALYKHSQYSATLHYSLQGRNFTHVGQPDTSSSILLSSNSSRVHHSTLQYKSCYASKTLLTKPGAGYSCYYQSLRRFSQAARQPVVKDHTTEEVKQTVDSKDNAQIEVPPSNLIVPESETQQKLMDLINNNFPPCELCFAYGSKVLLQESNTPTDKTMTDIIFVVKNAVAWHQENKKRNLHHYSLLMKLTGPVYLDMFHNDRAPYCVFNPFVVINGTLLKYGVIQVDKLYDDLEYWETLYIAGRLHKPVMYLHMSPTFDTYLLSLNKRSALYSALLMLPEKFNDVQLFHAIAKLSYHGDLRSVSSLEVAEYKVMNMVKPNLHHFRDYYRDQIDNSPFITRTDYGYCQKNKSVENVVTLHRKVPTMVFEVEDKIAPKSRWFRFSPYVAAKEQVIRKVAAGDLRYIEGNFKKCNFKHSRRMTVRGVMTAGLWPSLKYFLAKLGKRKKNPDIYRAL